MAITPKIFEFTSHSLDINERTLRFSFRQTFADREPLDFTETITLPKSINRLDRIPKNVIEETMKALHLILGVSYFKLYCPPEYKLSFQLSKEQASFWDTVYKNGLGEFMFQNNLDPHSLPKFPFSTHTVVSSSVDTDGAALVGIGGGKDSIVAAELLKEAGIPITGFVLETGKSSEIIENVVKEMGTEAVRIKRQLDEKIFEHHEGSYNGHVPISAVIAFLGVLTALAHGKKYVIMANEFSSNFGNLDYKGQTINHQWSKSGEFELLFQEYVRNFITPSVIYFSAVRPFYEIRIVEMFTRYKNYFPLFSSCNRSYLVHKERSHTLWCGQCPKCAFMFMMLSAFLDKSEVVGIFGKNMYEDEDLLPTFRDLLGFGDLKPFECVGTFEEAKAAMYLAKEKFSDSAVMKLFLPKITNGESLAKKVMGTNPAPTVPTPFRFLGMKSVLIVGYGREGKITEEYLKKYHSDLKIGIADRAIDPDYLKMQEDFDVAVKTPGMPPRLITIPYTTATNIFFNILRQNGNTIVGVTGSKGKSTTVTLIFEILKEAGLPVRLLGNIGLPMLSAALDKIEPKTIFVLELSSYMLSDLDMSPDVAVVTNLFPEHMDYHGSEEEYYNAKKHIVDYQKNEDHFVYNPNDYRLNGWAEQARSKVSPFAGDIPIPSEQIPLLGAHNQENIKAAIAAARIFNINDEVIARAIAGFKPLNHRLEKVGEFKGITFYDDAISTTPESTIAALEAIPNVKTIMLGGQDRGYDFRELERVLRLKGVENIVLFPDSGKRILSDRSGFNIIETASMKEAVEFAYSHTPPGSVCLLSCASPSYSVWKDFEAKGDDFQTNVKKQAEG